MTSTLPASQRTCGALSPHRREVVASVAAPLAAPNHVLVNAAWARIVVAASRLAEEEEPGGAS